VAQHRGMVLGALGQGDCLHAVGSIVNDAEADWQGDGFTACGREGSMFIPGLFIAWALNCKRAASVAHARGLAESEERGRVPPVVEAGWLRSVADKEESA
jgi:hypothetical protein